MNQTYINGKLLLVQQVELKQIMIFNDSCKYMLVWDTVPMFSEIHKTAVDPANNTIVPAAL